MGKTLDELNLAPDADPPDADPARRTPDAQRLLDEIEELQSDRLYNFAAETLNGIHDTVKRTGQASEGQQRAVANIRAGADQRDRHGRPRYERGRSRRYD